MMLLRTRLDELDQAYSVHLHYLGRKMSSKAAFGPKEGVKQPSQTLALRVWQQHATMLRSLCIR
jgi:hypothetical protein